MKTSAAFLPFMFALLLPGAALADQPAVTVYNQNFGVVREKVTLDLKPGVNPLRFTEITAHLEPDSVILRDPTGKHRLQVLEQNYCADPLSQGLLLSSYEGKTLEFLVYDQTSPYHEKPVMGKIIRSAYVPHPEAWNRYGEEYSQGQGGMMSSGAGQPIVEIDGKLRFGFPGTPIFPSLGDDTILKPTLSWLLETDAAGKLDAELSYVTGGMSWKADYNVVAPEQGDQTDLIGWITIDNQTGKTFAEAQIKLMAGDVSKIQPGRGGVPFALVQSVSGDESGPPVSEKAFDEYHLYTLKRATTLHDRETKQVEFVRATGIQSRRIYVYDGARIERRYQDWDATGRRIQSDYGTQCNPKVWAMREIDNNEKNGLGIPLPAGRVRCYRQDDDRRLEFVGENEIDHTPKDEIVRIYIGNAFDLVGERTRTEFKVNNDQDWLDESFEIKVRNHKKEAVEVRVVEHLYRWDNWEIREKTQEYVKKDSHTIEFHITVPPDGETVVTYLVHYWW